MKEWTNTVQKNLAPLAPTERLVAYDIGAAGPLPENWNAYASVMSVYAFDARPGSIHNPAAHLGLDFHKVEAAVGGANDPARDFFVTRGPGGSSFYRLDPKWSVRTSPADYCELISTEKLSVRTLSEIIDTGEAAPPNFMKLDIQGTELETLAALNTEHRSQIDGLVCEVEFLPLYKGQPLFEDVHELMREFGLTIFDLRTHRVYRPVDDTPFDWYRKHKGYARHSFNLCGRLVAGDALYLRDPDERPPENSDELKRIALILMMHNLFDHAWTAIDNAIRDRIIDRDEGAEMKEAVIQICPSPRNYEKRGWLAKQLYDLRCRFGGGVEQKSGWVEMRWPDQ